MEMRWGNRRPRWALRQPLCYWSSDECAEEMLQAQTQCRPPMMALPALEEATRLGHLFPPLHFRQPSHSNATASQLHQPCDRGYWFVADASAWRFRRYYKCCRPWQRRLLLCKQMRRKKERRCNLRGLTQRKRMINTLGEGNYPVNWLLAKFDRRREMSFSSRFSRIQLIQANLWEEN